MTIDPLQKNKSTLPGAGAQMHDQARTRLIMIMMVLMMGYLAISLRLIDLTMLRHPGSVETLARLGEASGVARAGKEAVGPSGKMGRGSIVDRNGILVAASLKTASVYADTTMVDRPSGLAKQLAAIMPEQNYQDLLHKLGSGKSFVWIQRNITPKQEYAINALGNPALGFQKENRRFYPHASLTAHIVGYTDLDGK